MAEVTMIYLPVGKHGEDQGVDEYLTAGHTVDDLMALRTPDLREPPEGEDDLEEPNTQSAFLVRYAEEGELFHTPDKDAFATLPVEDHYETHAVGSVDFKRWLQRRFYVEFGCPPGSQALQDALGTIEAKARFDGNEHEVYIRVAEHEGAIYVDLANEAWEAVKITPEGVEVVSDPPVRFRRRKGMLALPHPTEGGKVEALKRFVNLKDAKDWLLLAAWLVQVFRPLGPYPILILQGEQGSAKTTLARILRAIGDPSTAPVRSAPRGEQDLTLAANNSWVVALDNLSGLPPWLSDALCRLSTGGGFGTRKLYANDEEALFDATRPVILNGITDVATRADLLDRAIILSLPAIPEGERKAEAELWREFGEALPKIIGGIFEAVSTALRELPSVELPSRPRMADFAEWATAAETALGMEPGGFIEAYAGSRKETNQLALEADPVAVAVVKLMEGCNEWIGTTAQLLKALGKHVDDDVRRFKTWPKQPQHLSRHLKRLAPVLRGEGIEVEDLPRKGSERRKRLYKNKPADDHHDPHDRHAGPEAHKLSDSESDGSDDNVTVTANEGLKNRHPEKPIEASESTERDGSDDEMQPLSKGALVTTPEELGDLVAKVCKANVVGLDIETYPQDDTNAALDPRRGMVRLLQVAAEGVAGVVDVSQVNPTPLLEALQKKTLVAHNGKFDLSFLKSCFGYEHDGPLVDTQILDAVIYYAAGPRLEKDDWEGFPKDKPYRRSLADVADDYLKIKLDKESQSSNFGQDELSEKQVEYALKDVEILLPLKEAMLERARELGLEHTVELESRVTPALVYCESNGFALDTEGWREQAQRAKEEERQLKGECDAMAPPLPEDTEWDGWGWGPSNHRKVGKALELLGAKVEKNPKTGNYLTSEDKLKQINSPPQAARLAETSLRYRGAAKYTSTWGLGWFDPPKKKPKGKKFDKSHQFVVDGRVYTSFNQVVKTGRMSSEKPNIQNIPPELRKYFIAPPGRKLLIADYEQIEFVAVATIAGEKRMLEAFRRGEDIHSSNARKILESDPAREGRPVTEAEVKAFRPKAKTVGFGVIYGMTPYGLAQRLSDRFGVPTTEEQAQALIDRLFEGYPTLGEWYREECRKAARCEDVTHTLIGRRRLLDISMDYYGYWEASPSLRLNTPVQGSAGDGFKAAVALLWEKRHDCPGDPKVVNLVHDEVVLEIDAEHVDGGKSWLEERMIKGMKEVLGPEAPVSVEITVADNWGEKE